ncbi:39S ribosomal protein L55, mitochondrial-like [Mizuhopecten yessoensis]|uniref:39S ribosomal protein L55, mitochondrial-like n=1 Tax=Mizuhopecten yessoensis TaxID=6573 RepID=UPI000B457E9E|nr:39S ribosomal protein L55, mitochondrial-like [Mizuhopecten yessoensis]
MAALTRFGESLCKVCQRHLAHQYQTMSSKTSLTRCRRKIYVRQYPTTVVYPDGSTITVRYKEPRKLITLPINVSELSEEEANAVILKRTPRKKIKVVEEFEDDFDSSAYSHIWKKKSVKM